MLDGISPSSILAGVVFGLIGMYVFRQGKREQNIPLVLAGLGLMLYSWFTKGPLQDWGIGAAFCAVAYYYW